jgi:3-hydroxyacyl-CoA dehydrogenase
VPPESQRDDSSPIESDAREYRPTIALIGATAIAEQIAAAALRVDLTVIIDDVSDSRLQAISLNLRDIVGAQHCCAPGPHDQSDSPQSGFSSVRPTLPQDQPTAPKSALSSALISNAIPNLHLTQSIESAICQSDFLIDALPDDLEVKLELFTLFDKFAKPTAIFITTGSLPIDDLAAITFCPDRCLAVHLTTAPNATAPTFHLIPAQQTSPQTLAATSALFKTLFNSHAK